MRTKILNLAAEGFVIVVGILLAFSIEQWGEDRGDEQEEQLLLRELEEEFQRNLDLVSQAISFRKAKQKAAEELLLMKSRGGEFDEAVVDRLLADLTYWHISRFATGALDSVVLGGKLSLIENGQLRHTIASWREELMRVIRIERQDYDTSKTIFMPYLHEHASMTQISNENGERRTSQTLVQRHSGVPPAKFKTTANIPVCIVCPTRNCWMIRNLSR